MAHRTKEQIDADNEEMKYLGWIAADGPAKAEEKNRLLAEESIIELEAAGYKILSREMKRIDRFCDEYNRMEIVVRKDDTLKILQWSTFNKGWMQRHDGYSAIFKIGRD